MSYAVIYPGTFDPLTNGHTDVIIRAASRFEKVIVAIAKDTSKTTLLSFEERCALCHAALIFLPNVIVAGYQKLLAAFAEQEKIYLILRGVRAIADFEYERQLSRMNQSLNPRIETIFMTPNEKFAHISSSFVKDIARLGGDISAFVPPIIAHQLNNIYKAG